MAARKIDQVVSVENLERFANRLNMHLSQLLMELPPAEAEAEQQRRMAVMHDTVRLMTRGGLACLKEFHPEHYHSIVRASVRYARDRLRNRPASFVPKPRSRSELPNHWLFLPVILSAYDMLVPALKRNWAPAAGRETAREFISRDGRYGAAQHRGTDRRFQTENRRIKAIQLAARDLAESESEGNKLVPVPGYSISNKKARGWVRTLHRPSSVAMAILADYLNAAARRLPEIRAYMGLPPHELGLLKPTFTTRRMRALLVQARANDRELQKLRTILDGGQSSPPF